MLCSTKLETLQKLGHTQVGKSQAELTGLAIERSLHCVKDDVVKELMNLISGSKLKISKAEAEGLGTFQLTVVELARLGVFALLALRAPEAIDTFVSVFTSAS